MKGIGLGPSPNWYCSKVSDYNADGVFAYGARKDVYLLDVSEPSSQVPKYAGCLSGHGEQVTGVKFCGHENHQFKLASAPETGNVKIWDVTSQVQVKEITNLHKHKLVCIDWSSVDPKTLVLGDAKGFVSVNNVEDPTKTRVFNVSNNPIVAVALSPYDERTLVVGFRGGLVVIVNIKTLTNVHILRKHDDDVQCLCWAPASFGGENIFNAPDLKCFLTSSKDGTIRMWNGDDGKLLCTSKVPGSSGYRAKYNDDRTKSRLWIALNCSTIEDNCIICSGQNGEIFYGIIEKANQVNWKLVNNGSGHHRSVFNISTRGNYLITISMDRQIVVWDMIEKMPSISLSTLGGFVYCIQFAPVDAGYLAAGIGDNMIRIWNLQPNAKPYAVEWLWQGIKSKVTALAWHPSHEGWLAFGTSEGRVGIYKIHTNKPPKIFNTCHKGTVYSITWGPFCSDNKQGNKKDFALFTCDGTKIFMHFPNQMQKDAIDVDDIIRESNLVCSINDDTRATKTLPTKYPPRTELCWKPDFSALAVGNEDGTIDIFRSPDLKCVAVIIELKKQIQCLRWHPEFTSLASEPSEMNCWLAAAACDSNVYLFDLKPVLTRQDGDGSIVTISKTMSKLHGHKARVVSLAWNPHIDGQLGSTSYDGTAQIWDAKASKPIVNFQGHNGRVFTIAWSIFDPDVVFTGSDDFSVQQWKISEQTNILPTQKEEKRKARKQKKPALEDKIVPQPIDVPEASSNADIMLEIQELLAKKKAELAAKVPEVVDEATSSIVNTFQPFANDETTALETQMETLSVTSSGKDTFNAKSKKKKRPKSLFPVSCTLENRGKAFLLEDISLLCKSVERSRRPPKDDDDESSEDDVEFLGTGTRAHLGFYGGRTDTMRMMNTEIRHHNDNCNPEHALVLQTWNANIGKVIEEAASKRQLTDSLVALAPLVSHSLWAKTCKLYSEQLLQSGDALQATTYLLAVHDVYGAIDVLRTRLMFRETVALAKARLSPQDPLLHEIVYEWHKQLILDGNYEQACECLMSIDRIDEAIEVLAKRSDAATLTTVARLCTSAGDPKKADRYANKSFMMYQLKHEWKAARSVLDVYQSLRNHLPMLVLHEMLNNELLTLKSDAVLWHLDVTFLRSRIHEDDVVVWDVHHVDGQRFLPAVKEQWLTKNLIPHGDGGVRFLHAWIEENQPTVQSRQTLSEIIMQVAYHLTLSLLNETEDVVVMLSNIVEALAACEHEQQISQSVCRILFPDGIATFQKTVLGRSEGNDEVKRLMRVISAYYGSSVLTFLQMEQNVIELRRDLENNPSDNLTKILTTFLSNSLLVENHALVHALHLKLNFVVKSIAQSVALGKMGKDKRLATSLEDKESTAAPLDDAKSENVNDCGSVVNDADDTNVDDRSSLDVERKLEKYADNVIELNLEYVLQNAPYDEVYENHKIPLSELREEKTQIESLLKMHSSLKVDKSPDPTVSALSLLKWCQTFDLVAHRREIHDWVLKFSTLRSQRMHIEEFRDE